MAIDQGWTDTDPVGANSSVTPGRNLMGIRVEALARIDPACHELLRQRLKLPLGASVDLDQLTILTDPEQIDLPRLQAGISGGPVCMTLSALAPDPFARARDLLAGAGLASLDPYGLAVPVQVLGNIHAALLEAVALASARVAAALRDIAAEAFTDVSAELGYKFSICRGAVATGIELRHESELVLLRIHDGGALEAEHAGLLEAICEDRQLALQQAAVGRGIIFANRRQQYYEAGSPGSLISVAVSRGDTSLARATALEAEASMTSMPTHQTPALVGETARPWCASPIRRTDGT
jgi:hypothetical protein